MFAIIIGPDFHLPFPLFWDSSVHLAVKKLPPLRCDNINHGSQCDNQTMQAAPVLITTLSDKTKKQTSHLLHFNLQHEMTRAGVQGWHKQIRREGMCDRTCYHLVLGPEEWRCIQLCQHSYSSHTHTHTQIHTLWMAAKESEERDEVAVKAISSWEKGLIILVRQSIWDDWGQMGKTVWNSAMSSFAAIVFSVTFSLESFSDAFPLFLRDFTLIMADKQQGFPVDVQKCGARLQALCIARAIIHVSSHLVHAALSWSLITDVSNAQHFLYFLDIHLKKEEK